MVFPGMFRREVKKSLAVTNFGYLQSFFSRKDLQSFPFTKTAKEKKQEMVDSFLS